MNIYLSVICISDLSLQFSTPPLFKLRLLQREDKKQARFFGLASNFNKKKGAINYGSSVLRWKGLTEHHCNHLYN